MNNGFSKPLSILYILSNCDSMKLLNIRTLVRMWLRIHVDIVSLLFRCYQSDSAEMEAYLAYFSEGIRNLQNWESVMKHQRRNGSLFNSPSTTAAAYMSHQNPGCLDYLQSALKMFGNAGKFIAFFIYMIIFRVLTTYNFHLLLHSSRSLPYEYVCSVIHN